MQQVLAEAKPVVEDSVKLPLKMAKAAMNEFYEEFRDWGGGDEGGVARRGLPVAQTLTSRARQSC